MMEAARHCPGRVGQMGSVSTRGGQGRPQRERVMKPGRVQRALQDSIRQNGGWRREGGVLYSEGPAHAEAQTGENGKRRTCTPLCDSTCFLGGGWP